MELSTEEKMALEIFASDAHLLGAVQKIVLGTLTEKRNNTKSNMSLSDEQIGAGIRACDTAMKWVDEIFREIASFKRTETLQPKVNPAI